jgi:hypothetical protein
MQIFFGHKASENGKISSALSDRGIRMFRASPGEIHAVGLNRLQQPGYLSYMMALPAFMHANETRKVVGISARGYPLTIAQSLLIPIDFPKVFIKAKKGQSNVYGGKFEEYMARSDGTTYLAPFDKALLGIIRSPKVDSSAYSPAPFIRLYDVPAMITIARLVSSFFRTHRYPAYADDDHFEEIQIGIETTKHNREPEDDNMIGAKRRVIEVNSSVGPVQGFLNVDDTVKEGLETSKVVFHVAKPGHASNLTWGLPSDIPQTHGIHFPYVDELSKVDKDTVPRVLEKYFIRALGRTTEEALRNYSDVVQGWKASLSTTLWGRQMSHLFRVIEIALPAQARPFPIVDSGLYCGAFLSGAGFSVGMGKDVHRPDTYAKSFMELGCYGTNDTIIEEIAAAVGLDTDSEDLPEFRLHARKGVRSLSKWIRDNRTFGPTELEAATKLTMQLRTNIPYRVPNVAGLKWAIDGIKSGEEPDESEPMYPMAMFNVDIFSLYLSAFGPLAPSPEMPGGSLMKLTSDGRLPEKFNKVLAMRLVTMETAIVEWRAALSSGVIHNGFTNLSAPYEYSTITGKDAKQNWFSYLCEFSKWYKAQVVPSDKNSGIVAPTTDAGIDWSLVEEGLDFADF